MSKVNESIERIAFKPINGMSVGNNPEDGMIETTELPEFKAWYVTKEHRCSCGRLLGKFAGQAEVKCPKCGKVNVIGVEK